MMVATLPSLNQEEARECTSTNSPRPEKTGNSLPCSMLSVYNRPLFTTLSATLPRPFARPKSVSNNLRIDSRSPPTYHSQADQSFVILLSRLSALCEQVCSCPQWLVGHITATGRGPNSSPVKGLATCIRGLLSSGD